MPLTLYNQFEGHWCHWTCKWCKCLAISIHSYSFWETSVTMWIPMWIEHKWTWQSWLSLAGCQRRSHVSLGGPLQYGPFSGSTCKSCKHQEKSEYQPFAPLTETCKWPNLVQNLSRTCPKLVHNYLKPSIGSIMRMRQRLAVSFQRSRTKLWSWAPMLCLSSRRAQWSGDNRNPFTKRDDMSKLFQRLG